ncbi:hypothetical protein [Methylomonas sp. AM2-LC]|uniref:hypothetical protein n=1 Tax=Methylomonas sp. AM2-LC TaxID=3153301 RepID=UPI00326670B2
MSSAYYIVLEKEINDLDTMMDGKKLSHNIELLDILALQLGVRPLSDFFCMDPDELADFMDGDDEIELPPLLQFSALDGLVTVRTLLSSSQAQEALEDLQSCERILTAAAEAGVGWHFQVDL